MKIILIRNKVRKRKISFFTIEKKLKAIFKDIKLLEEDSKNIKILIDDNSIDEVISKLLEKKINDNFYIGNEKIVITEIKLLSDTQKIEDTKFKMIDKSVNIKFINPVFFKIGFNFLEELSISIFFKLMLRLYNKKNIEEFKLELKDVELKKIIIRNNNIKLIEVEDRGEILRGFVGEMNLDFSNIEDEEIEKYEKIFNYIKNNEIGYKVKGNFAKVELI